MAGLCFLPRGHTGDRIGEERDGIKKRVWGRGGLQDDNRTLGGG